MHSAVCVGFKLEKSFVLSVYKQKYKTQFFYDLRSLNFGNNFLTNTKELLVQLTE